MCLKLGGDSGMKDALAAQQKANAQLEATLQAGKDGEQARQAAERQQQKLAGLRGLASTIFSPTSFAAANPASKALLGV
jgi:hypothetical protein